MEGEGHIIDAAGFRENVGIIVCNEVRRVIWFKRSGQNAWQFPQGGIHPNEPIEQALFRELKEETGLDRHYVDIVACTKEWLRYRFPERLIQESNLPKCIGQKQRWFLLRLKTDENKIDLNNADKPEFDDWRWVDYWYPLEEVVAFKRKVYEKVLQEFEPLVFH